MIGLDTNVLVRFLTGDDPAQTAIANQLIASLTPQAPGYLCREVLVEVVWVLERAYHLDRADISHAIDSLLEAQELVIEAPDRVAVAIDRYRRGGPGFADQMIALSSLAAGCSEVASFDRKAGTIPGMRVLSST